MSDVKTPKDFVDAMKVMIAHEVDSHIEDLLSEMGKQLDDLNEQEIEVLLVEACRKRDELFIVVLDSVREYQEGLEETVH
jgi:hypothetical protein